MRSVFSEWFALFFLSCLLVFLCFLWPGPGRGRGSLCTTTPRTPEFRFDPEALQITLDQRYDFCVIKDESSYINSNRIKELGADDTVVGHLVRVAARRTEAVTDEEEKRAVERALRHALSALGVV